MELSIILDDIKEYISEYTLEVTSNEDEQVLRRILYYINSLENE